MSTKRKPARAGQRPDGQRAGRPRPGGPETHVALLDELRTRLREVHDLRRANAVLNWDQSTYMPPGGAAARGRQKALLNRLAHEMFTDTRIGELLDRLESTTRGTDPDSDTACLLRVTRSDYERSIRVPKSFVERVSAHGSACYQTWTRARPANDFAAVRDGLERTLDLSRELSGHLAPLYPPDSHIADPFIDGLDEGMTVASVQALFDRLRAELVPLVRAVTARAPADDSCLRLHYPKDRQLAFCLQAAVDLGYDLNRGRLDTTHHPFMTAFARDDVRITTRVNEHDLGDALFSTLHEAGHALYEMGVAPELEGTPLGHGASSGLHESQSRLWENIVGRGRAYWQHAYPKLQAAFPEQLGRTGLDVFHRAINKVQCSLIRTDADEVTYNLHVMLRFDLELALLAGRLAVRDLPAAWAQRYHADLGIAPTDDNDGVLQDVHWYGGIIGGGFQGYTIGNILSAQLYGAALAVHPGIEDDIRRGEMATLRGWLTDNVYRHGAKFPPAALIERATGQPMTIAPYMAYLRAKF